MNKIQIAVVKPHDEIPLKRVVAIVDDQKRDMRFRMNPGEVLEFQLHREHYLQVSLNGDLPVQVGNRGPAPIVISEPDSGEFAVDDVLDPGQARMILKSTRLVRVTL